MSNAYPLYQAVGLLRDVLKRSPVGFLMGAGCPASIRLAGGNSLIPTMRELTISIVEKLRLEDDVLTTSLLQRTRTATEQEPNAESILSYVRALVAVLQAGDTSPTSKEQAQSVEAAICKSIVLAVDKRLPEGDTPYRRLASWSLAASDQLQLEFFTTNYDLLLEEAFEKLLVPFFDGFVGSHTPFFDLAAIENDVLPARWTRLWKLHGSINWCLNDGRAYRTKATGNDGSLLIYPSHLKYDQSRRLPFVAMADRLLAFLRKDKSTLISCGFSYADQHLNDLISSGLRANPSSTLIALMFGAYAEDNEIAKMAHDNLHISAYFADRAVIGGVVYDWDFSGVSADAPRWSLTMATETSGQKFTGGDFDALTSFLGQMVNYDPPKTVAIDPQEALT